MLSQSPPLGKDIRADLALAFIIKFKKAHDGCSPSFREIGEAIGVDSTSLVSGYLECLEAIGKIELQGELGATRMIKVIGGSWTPPEETQHDMARITESESLQAV